MISRLCIVGVGLIGGSLARDLRRLGLVEEIVGSSRDVENLKRAVELGVIDRYDPDPGLAVQGADVVLLGVPLGSMASVLRRIAQRIPPEAVVTDVGSAKSSVVEDARRALGPGFGRFVPGHPIAGTELSGIDASVEDLFLGRRVILTPVSETLAEAVDRVRSLWESVGAQVLEMDVEHHDEVLAATSHLPHMLAYTLMDVLGRTPERVEIFRYAAGGLRDFTRIASSDPQMWHDICVANRAALLSVLERFQDELDRATTAVRDRDGPALFDLFTRARKLRDRYITESEVPSLPPGTPQKLS